MISDLAQLPGDTSLSTGIVIIGGGIAGLLLAVKLCEHKIPVVVLESGGLDEPVQPHPLNDVVQLGRTYAGALNGRARGLGGTSTLWGGALIPFLPEDMQARPYIALEAWPVDLHAVAPYIGELEQLFGIDERPFDERFVASKLPRERVPVGDTDFTLRFAKWPPFKKRNVANLFRTRLKSDPNLTIYLNSTVTAFACNNMDGRLTGVEARHVGGHTLKVTADRFIVCTGAIEATRLLLLLDRQTQARAFAHCRALGRYFHDHVSARAGEISTSRPQALNRLAGFRFVGSTMRSLRFEMTPAAQAVEGVGSSFGHISFQTACPGGFDALRNLLRKLQRTGRLDTRSATQVARDLPYLTKVGYWRYVHKQLRWPEPARYELHIVAEQLPKASNRIALASQTDMLGVPLAAIDWQIGEDEHTTISAFARRFNCYWRRHELDKIGSLEWVPAIGDGKGAEFEQIGDVFHPGGTTRMGGNAEDAVVDGNLKAFAVSNLWVASTSVFPSGGSANPTMMLMLFVLRLAEHLVSASR